MAQSNNFLSILYAFWENGSYLQFPVFKDYSARQVVMVRQINVPSSAGAQPITPALVVIEQNPKSLTWNEAHLALGEYNSLNALQTALDALNSGNCYTLYTGLVSINKFDNISDAGGSILLADDAVIERIYNVSKNQTSLIVNIINDLIYTEVIVSGDQTNAGTYYYNTLY
jgi:hypothetical protein